MKIKGYFALAAALIFIVVFAYFIQFYFFLDYRISKEADVWGQFGDYVGGVLNPFLGFVSISLLIKSLSLQHEANASLKAEMYNGEKTEVLRSFESLFFNLINSQKQYFDSFFLEFSPTVGRRAIFKGAKAVMAIEDSIESMRSNGCEDSEIKSFLNRVDQGDQLFGLSRSFYVIVMTVNDRLCEKNGFSIEDRKRYFKVLVNFTDFALLRLIMACTQFLDYESSKYLRSCKEFEGVINELGLRFDLY